MRRQALETYFTLSASLEATTASVDGGAESGAHQQGGGSDRTAAAGAAEGEGGGGGYEHELRLPSEAEQGCEEGRCECSTAWDAEAQAQDAAQHWRLMRTAFDSRVWSEA